MNRSGLNKLQWRRFVFTLILITLGFSFFCQTDNPILQDSSFIANENLLNDAIKSDDSDQIIRLSANKIKLLESHKMYDDAINLALEVEKSFCSEKNYKDEYCQSCYRINDIIFDFMWKIENYSACLDYAERSYFSKCILPDRMNNISFKFASTLKEIYGIDSAASILKQNHLSVFNHPQAKDFSIVHSVNNIGVFYSNLSIYDSAIVYYKQAVQTCQLLNDSLDIKPVIYGNIGVCFLSTQQIDSALYYLELDVEGSSKFKNKSSYIYAEIAMAEIESEYVNLQKGQKKILELYSNYVDQMNYNQHEKALELIIKNSLLMNQDASIYFDKLLEIKTIQGNEEQKKFHDLSQTYSNILLKNITEIHAFEKEIDQNKIDLLEKDKAVQFQRLILIIISILFILITGLILFIRYRASQRTKLKLIEQDRIIQEKNAEILQLQVEKNHEDLNQLALELTGKNDLAEKIGTRIAEIEGISKVEVSQVKLYIRNELELKSTRSKLQEDINKISGQFLDKIRIKHPDLTDSDLKLIAMIILNQSNKEIALQKNITAGSVKVTKNRLKKKLNLSPETELAEYLKEFY